jgi:flagellar FliL protein
MAEQALDKDVDGDDEVEVEAKPRARGIAGKKLVLFVAAPLLLLMIGGAGAYFTGLFDSLLGGEGSAGAELHGSGPAQPATFYDLPEMLVNLNTTGRNSSFLKISVSLEIANEADRAKLDRALPRIVDNFQVYLRELRIEDLNGSAGLQRLREELLLRVNAAVEPGVVKDVLFKEMLVQ